MKRRRVLQGLALAPLVITPLSRTRAAEPARGSASVDELQRSWKSFLAPGADVALTTEALERADAEWKAVLAPAAYHVLREAGTEAPFSSFLNDEKRPGIYACAGCRLPLFTSAMKYDSGTGWPSFFTTIPDVFATKTDYHLLFLARTEYHCARCGGHHGHVFDDGPPPTGQRWCNNGVALRFIPRNAA